MCSFAEAISQATTAAIESMCFTTVLEEAVPQGSPLDFIADVAFSGDAIGTLRIELTADAAASVATGFLGLEADELDEPATQAVVLELANMVCGCMLSIHEPTGSFTLDAPRIPPVGTSLMSIASCAYQLEVGTIQVSLAASATEAVIQ